MQSPVSNNAERNVCKLFFNVYLSLQKVMKVAVIRFTRCPLRYWIQITKQWGVCLYQVRDMFFIFYFSSFRRISWRLARVKSFFSPRPTVASGPPSVPPAPWSLPPLSPSSSVCLFLRWSEEFLFQKRHDDDIKMKGSVSCPRPFFAVTWNCLIFEMARKTVIIVLLHTYNLLLQLHYIMYNCFLTTSHQLLLQCNQYRHTKDHI